MLFFSSFYSLYIFILFYFCFFIILAVFTLEIGVAFIQSYVFIMLKLIYLGEIFNH